MKQFVILTKIKLLLSTYSVKVILFNKKKNY